MRDDPSVSAFIPTIEYLNFTEFCEACSRDRYIGLCYGSSGVGKTLSALQYAGLGTLEMTEAALAASWSFLPERLSIPKEVVECNTVFYTPDVVNTPSSVATGVAELRSKLSAVQFQARDRYSLHNGRGPALKDVTQLVIVDEADRLSVRSLEQLRAIYDRHGIGLILMGIPGIEKRMSRYAQFYSRVGFVHLFRTLGGKELRSVLVHYWQGLGLEFDDSRDEEVLADITRTTCGNFRLIQRLFSQIARILENNPLRRLTTISKEVLEKARESLVIGVT